MLMRQNLMQPQAFLLQEISPWYNFFDYLKGWVVHLPSDTLALLNSFKLIKSVLRFPAKLANSCLKISLFGMYIYFQPFSNGKKIILFFSCLSVVYQLCSCSKENTFLSFENKIHVHCNNYREYN